MRRTATAAAVLLLAASFARAAGTDLLSPLHFLLGEWIAVNTPAGESGSFSFRLEVQNHVIVRRNEARYDATPERAASRHDDLLVIYNEGGSLKADYFDSEGHVIRYAVQPRSADGGVVLVSTPAPGEPRYRLTYTRGADGILVGSFEIAAPGSPEAFKPYLSWKARRRSR